MRRAAIDSLPGHRYNGRIKQGADRGKKTTMTEQRRTTSWPVRLAPWLLIGGLVLFYTVNNWVWLKTNVTSTGWDKPRHLAQSLNYAQMLRTPGLRSLFNVMTGDPVRPPFFPASASIMYALFGRSADVATMVNIVYLVVALISTYGIGRRWGGRTLGLVGVVLLSIFPMFYAMSRYFYLEFALTGMVSLTVYLLLTTDGFRRKGASLAFGVSLGLGLLTKRTFVVFAAGPILAIVLSAGLLPMLWRRLRRRPRLHGKPLLIALLGGLALTALWYLPNREAIRGLVLGDALFPLWWALASLALYFALLPSAPLSNALAAFFLAATLASTWYLARIEFLERVALYGYGIDDPRGRQLRLDRLNTYLYYIRKLGNEHMSFFLFALFFFVLVLAAILFVRRRGGIGPALRRIRPEGWAVLAWIGGGYVLLTLSIYQETRAFTPVLPAVALLCGAALLKLPWRWVRRGVLALVLAFGLVQFFVLSYESVYRLLPPLTIDLPGWGPTTTFAQGVYIQLPDEGETDSGYAIYHDLLDRMESYRRERGLDRASVGLLVNTSQINAGPINYLILTEYPHLRVESLINRFDERSPYRRIFAHDYIAVKKVNGGAGPTQQEVIDAILEDPPPLFAQTFELETTYPLPDGDTVYLYRQRYRLPADYPVEYVIGLAGDLTGQTQAGDAVLLTPPELVGPFVGHYEGPAEVFLIPESEEALAGIAADYDRIFLVMGDPAAGTVQDWAERWLDRHAFRASHTWSGSLQLILYGTAQGPLPETPTTTAGTTFGGRVELTGYDLPEGTWQPGDVVRLSLFWRKIGPLRQGETAFTHLLDGTGRLVTQNDVAPGGHVPPAGGWSEGEIVAERRGLFLPDDLPPGEYTLRLGVYLPETGERLPATGPHGEDLGDGVTLGTITVGP